jgi:hypothetical protein
MGILGVFKLGDGWGMKLTDKLQRTYTETYEVLTDSFLTGPLEVCFAPGLPRYGQIYVELARFDGHATVISIEPKLPDPNAPFVWHVLVTYSSHLAADPSQQDQQQGDNPTLRPPRFSFSTVKESRAISMTTDDTPKLIANSANQPFDPPYEREISRTRETITLYRATYDADFYDNFKDSINDDFFSGYYPKQGRIVDIDGEQHYENKVRCYEIKFVIEYRTPDWNLYLPDMGKWEVTTINGSSTRKMIVDRAGLPVGGIMLDGRGNQLKLDPNNPPKPVELNFQVYPRKNWAPLKLPDYRDYQG